MLGAGLVVSVVVGPALAQRRGGRGGGGGFRGGPPPALSARIHIGDDGTITVLSGKVDAGQGARTRNRDGRGRGIARAARADRSGARRHRPDARRRHDGRQRHHAADDSQRSAGRGRGAEAARRSCGREMGRRGGRGRSSRRQGDAQDVAAAKARLRRPRRRCGRCGEARGTDAERRRAVADRRVAGARQAASAPSWPRQSHWRASSIRPT